MKVKDITRLAVVAALYVALTLLVHPYSYGQLQFRISEVLVLLCFYRKDYKYSLILGCLIANILSPYGVLDMVFGTLATAISVILISKSKNLFLSSMYPVLLNGIIVGALLYYTTENPVSIFLLMAYVAIGEFVVVSIVGVILFKLLEKNKLFLDVIEANQNVKYE